MGFEVGDEVGGLFIGCFYCYFMDEVGVVYYQYLVIFSCDVQCYVVQDVLGGVGDYGYFVGEVCVGECCVYVVIVIGWLVMNFL